jgi:transcription-repair coupling factor (superfamily II helicase)
MHDAFSQAYKQLVSTQGLALTASAQLLLELFATSVASQQPVIIISKNPELYWQRLKNLHFFNQSTGNIIWPLPSDERTVMHATASDPALVMERMHTRFNVALGEKAQFLIMPPLSLLEKGPSAGDLQKHAQLLIKNGRVNRDELLGNLITLGYAKVSSVLDRGTFAVRGSIIDIFLSGHRRPIRIDLFGDEIESIKYFDENTKRNISDLDSIFIGGVKEIFLDIDTKSLAEEKLSELADELNYPTQKLNEKLRDIRNGINFYGIEKLLPAFFSHLCSILELISTSYTHDQKPVIIFDDKSEILDSLRAAENNLEELHRQALIRGDLVFAVQDYFISVDKLTKLLENFTIVDIRSKNLSDSLNFASKDTSDIRQEILQSTALAHNDREQHLLKPLSTRIKKLQQEGLAVIITVASRAHEEELKNLLQPFGLNIISLKEIPSNWLDAHKLYKSHVHAYILINKSPLAFGGIFNFARFALIAEDDIFGHKTKRRGSGGKQKGFSTALSDLEPGDLVVHVDHGIGKFAGLVRLNMRGVDNDYILILYAKDEKLYLPVHRINLIKPHGGANDSAVRLDRLGGTAWLSKKSKVKEAVMVMAQDLIKLYAKRSMVERPPFITPDTHFHEFEAAFEFETTEDQQKAIEDVVSDMQKKQPMDRLVCGDVGYGKTEVAMRAAMLAVLSKRQVAILAPTTVLAQQHGITFRERFKDTGAQIAVLSRFQKPAEIKAVLEALKKNQVDIIIGTHRLLSPDVHFQDLGLMVVDEEQRFGIKAKEHLKKMRTKVDVLTMSATPIPRTMQMSYFGIRDLSIIETPPVDRRSIQTQVAQFDDAVIKEAILREISRGGQVYFVHNRVKSINATADYLRLLVPEAKIGVAHGQMGEDELEHKMLSFIAHEINVLVCTTIIETGIDVSSANTMFIDDADDFGLSQLYQLRGRIGRSKERAFAYLLIKTSQEQLSPIAKTRLEILHKFSELGAGFRIAQHDLELRGAGDLLGKSQHGHMAAIGYDLYADLLKEAIKELKGQSDEDSIDAEVIVPISAMLPEKYLPDLHERLAFYQRLACAESLPKISSIMLELEDLYGDVPEEVLALGLIAEIRLALKKIHGVKLEVTRSTLEGHFNVSISLSPQAPLDDVKLKKVMSSNKNLRITPQQKIIQVIGNAHPNIQAALLAASQQAINVVYQELF